MLSPTVTALPALRCQCSAARSVDKLTRDAPTHTRSRGATAAGRGGRLPRQVLTREPVHHQGPRLQVCILIDRRPRQPQTPTESPDVQRRLLPTCRIAHTVHMVVAIPRALQWPRHL